MKTDARVRYTQAVIRDAFLRLLSEKPARQITVTELCALAQINRATFYKHYRDPLDLLQQLETGMLQHLQETARQMSHGPEAHALMLRMLEDLRRHHAEYACIASENGDAHFPLRVSQTLYKEVGPRVTGALPHLSAAQQRMTYRFIEAGGSGILTDWLQSGMQESPETVARLIFTLSKAVLRQQAAGAN